jgi:hypothetical protein
VSLHVQYRSSRQILITFQFPGQTSEKISSNIKFHEYLSIGSRLFSMRTDRRTDGHETNSSFSKFCERA